MRILNENSPIPFPDQIQAHIFYSENWRFYRRYFRNLVHEFSVSKNYTYFVKLLNRSQTPIQELFNNRRTIDFNIGWTKCTRLKNCNLNLERSVTHLKTLFISPECFRYSPRVEMYLWLLPKQYSPFSIDISGRFYRLFHQ